MSILQATFIDRAVQGVLDLHCERAILILVNYSGDKNMVGPVGLEPTTNRL